MREWHDNFWSCILCHTHQSRLTSTLQSPAFRVKNVRYVRQIAELLWPKGRYKGTLEYNRSVGTPIICTGYDAAIETVAILSRRSRKSSGSIDEKTYTQDLSDDKRRAVDLVLMSSPWLAFLSHAIYMRCRMHYRYLRVIPRIGPLRTNTGLFRTIGSDFGLKPVKKSLEWLNTTL